jgi:hypothetical protein
MTSWYFWCKLVVMVLERTPLSTPDVWCLESLSDQGFIRWEVGTANVQSLALVVDVEVTGLPTPFARFQPISNRGKL